jgi:hypothetical protein
MCSKRTLSSSPINSSTCARNSSRLAWGPCVIARHAGPTPDFAVREQGKPAQIAAPARVPKVAEQVVEPELQVQW